MDVADSRMDGKQVFSKQAEGTASAAQLCPQPMMGPRSLLLNTDEEVVVGNNSISTSWISIPKDNL